MRTKLATSAIALALAAPGFALAQQQQQPAAGGADIQVQQPAPQITVKQPEPNITVQQPAPEVIIEQPKPQVIVEQPKPEVTVQQAKPQVEVQQQGQPDVQVQQPGQPDVTVVRPGAEQAQEEGAEPAVQPPATAAAVGEEQWYSGVRGEEIVGQTLYGTNGEEIGEIDHVVMSQGGSTPEALVGVGGFLGIGERNVAIPLNEIQMEGDRLTTDMTKEAIGGMEPYEESGYQEWDRTRPLGGAS
jgi:hypothetical protein